MRKRSSRTKKFHDETPDLNVLASQIVGAATEEAGAKRARQAEAVLDRLHQIGFKIIPQGPNDAIARGPSSPPELLAEILPDLKAYWPEIVQVLVDRGEVNPAAVLGRAGGLKGGKARAEKLSARKRSLIAKRAAKARWQQPK